MSNLAQRPPLGQRAPKPIRGAQDARDHMAAVAGLACCICGSLPVTVHHCISRRFGSRKASDFHTIPLCHNHHQGADGIHADKAAWESRWGLDTDYLPIVKTMIGENKG